MKIVTTLPGSSDVPDTDLTVPQVVIALIVGAAVVDLIVTKFDAEESESPQLKLDSVLTLSTSPGLRVILDSPVKVQVYGEVLLGIAEADWSSPFLNRSTLLVVA
ncbi:hypothetical protein [Pontibacter rugosus]